MTSYYVFNDTRYHLTNEPFPFNLFPTLFNPLEKKYGGSYQSVRGVLEKLKYTILHCSSICFFPFDFCNFILGFSLAGNKLNVAVNYYQRI